MRGLFKSLTPSKPASTANIRYDSSDSPVINSASDYLAYQAKMNEIKASQPQVISNEYGSYYMKDGVPIITYTFPETWVGERSCAYSPKEINIPEEQQIFIHKLCEGTDVDPLMVLCKIAHESSSNADAINLKSGTTGLMQTYPDYTYAYFDQNGCYCNNCKEILNKASAYFTEEDIEILSNSSTDA